MRKNADRDKDSRVTARGVLVQSETWVMGGGEDRAIYVYASDIIGLRRS